MSLFVSGLSIPALFVVVVVVFVSIKEKERVAKRPSPHITKIIVQVYDIH